MKGMRYVDFIDTGYKPGKNDLVCTFYLEAKNFRRAAGAVAAESSIGTWDPNLKTMRPGIRKLGAKVFHLKRNLIKISYPEELFERGNISQILSSIAGNIFGMKELDSLKLLDVEIPRRMVKSFPGPGFGVKGIRNLLHVRRPLLGTIIKPKLGLREKQHSRVAYHAWRGGLDIVKDDENLTDMRFNRFEKRVDETLKMRNRAEEETGEKKIYMPNITAPLSEMKRRADYVMDKGGEYVMIDIITTGFSALQEMRDYLNGRCVIHAHRAMHAAFTRNPKHGIDMKVVALFARLAGVDQLHTGTVLGKMEGEKEEVLSTNEKLLSDLYGLKKVLPVASGGLHPGMVPALVRILGQDLVIQAGGGVHGHPSGTEAGARAMRQALDAFMEGADLRDYSREHPELEEALKRWGVCEA